MTNIAISNNAAEGSNKDWKLFIYSKDAPVESDGISRDGNAVKCKILAGDKVQFKVKKVSELTSKKGNVEYKFVCAMRNFFSADEPLAHVGAFYRAMAITNLSPSSGRYIVKHLRVDGDVIDRKKSGLFEYLYGFMEDALNYCVYDEESSFEGKDLLIRLPGIFQGCKIATPVAMLVKPEFTGSRLFDVFVDGSTKKYALKRLKNGKAGIGTDNQLIAFDLSNLSNYLDKDGFHTDKDGIEVLPLSQENLDTFKRKYCQ